MLRSDIYKRYSPGDKRAILVISGLIAVLTPFTDTIYLPTLSKVASDLNTTDAVVSLSVSIYLAAVGFGQLVWGPLADRYGRLIILYIALVAYEATTIACVFSPNIGILILLRTLEGFFVGSTIVVASTLISDTFAPSERGSAMGAMLAPLLIGPIIAPIIGGILSQRMGWRSTFVLLSVMGIISAIFCVIFAKETHHWILLKAVLAEPTIVSNSNELDLVVVENLEPIPDGDVEMSKLPDVTNTAQTVKAISEPHPDDIIGEPEMVMPWSALRYIIDPQLAPFLFHSSISFMCMFVSLVLLPLKLALPPYSLSPGVVGVTFIPVGISMLIFAIVGGICADISASKYPSAPEGSLIYGLRISTLVILGCIGFGITLQNNVNLAGPLLTQCLIGAGQAAAMPALSGYLTTVRPNNAGAVSSIMMFMMFVFAAIGISFSVPIYSAIGFQNFQFLLAGLSLLSTACSLFAAFQKIGREKSGISVASTAVPLDEGR